MKRPAAHLPAGRYLLCNEGSLHEPGEKYPGMTVAAVVVIPRGQPTRRQIAEALRAPAVNFLSIAGFHDSWVKQHFVAPSDAETPVAVYGIDLAGSHDVCVETFFVDGKPLFSHEIDLGPVEWPEVNLGEPLPLGGAVKPKRPYLVGEQPSEQMRPVRKRDASTPAPKAPPIDAARLAAAYRAKASASRKAQGSGTKVPTRRALGIGPCHKCGASGRNGCDHFLPYIPENRR